MLLKSKITDVPMYSGGSYFDGWLKSRLGKFTASKISCCMQPKGIGDTGVSYIRSRVFEELNGVSSEKEIDTEAIRWGIANESKALMAFIKAKNIPSDEHGRVPIILQRAISDKESKFGCTPDGIWIQQEYEEDGKVYVIAVPIETKCYQLQRHLKCVVCDTPEKIKSVDPDAFWQLIMQMDECDALVGYLVYYYPELKYGGLRVIEFKKINLIQDFRLFKERKSQIIKIYEEEKNVFLKMSN